MNFAPILGLVGAALASLSAFKWMLAAFLVVMIGWGLYSSRTTKNALDQRALKDLIKSSAQWNLRSSQDSNPAVALMNANYAMAYLNVARSLGSDDEIEKNCGVNIDTFLKDIEKAQSSSLQRLSKSCPSITKDLHLDNTGW
jgi:hypothetical protein